MTMMVISRLTAGSFVSSSYENNCVRISILIPTYSYKRQYPAPLPMSDFPVGLAYIAGALKAAGHEVYGCNPNNLYHFANAKEMAEITITRHLDQYRPDIICTGGLCTDYAFFRDAIDIIRRQQPGTPIILGGGIVSNDARYVFERLKPDFAVSGDGEHVVTQIVASISSGDFKHIPNTLYWKNGKAERTPENFHYPAIETLVYPEYDIFDAGDNLQNFSLAARPSYRFPRLNARPWVVVAGRGCPFRCTFCVHDRPTPYRTRSSVDVMKELAHFHDRYQFNILVILDELFAPKRERLIEFSWHIKQLRQERGWDLLWCFQTHANVGLTQEDILMAKDAGCFSFSYGMESASETVLASMRKKSHPKQISDAISMCRKAGVGFMGNFIFGDPAETPDTLKETTSFFQEHCETVHISLGTVHPYPGSTLYANCLKNKVVADVDQYYETIDECRYPMATAFPKKLWGVWCDLTEFLVSRGVWHRTATATVCDHESTHYFDISVLKARCPYCALDIVYRHAVVIDKRAAASGSQHPWTYRLVWDFRNHWLMMWLVSLVVRLIALRYSWFEYLKYAFRNGMELNNWVVTGCPNCNQCVRLAWKQSANMTWLNSTPTPPSAHAPSPNTQPDTAFSP